jgi:hypothetical protein
VVDHGELIRCFLQVAQLSGLNVADADVRVDFTPAPHRRPGRLPTDSQGVYIFFLGDTCLKVGKAGPKTAARFCGHHYGFHAPSTLARSIMAHRERVAALMPPVRSAEAMVLSQRSVSDWIETNTSRLNILLPCTVGPFALSLLEAFLHCRLQPIFEGHSA